MIDAHVHAFPALPGLSGTVANLAARLPIPGLPLGIERVASLRKMGSGKMHQALGLVMGFGLLPQVMLRGGLSDLERSMDRLGLERSVVIGGGSSAPNDWLLEAVRAKTSRFIPVTTLPPIPKNAPEST